MAYRATASPGALNHFSQPCAAVDHDRLSEVWIQTDSKGRRGCQHSRYRKDAGHLSLLEIGKKFPRNSV